MHFLRKIGVGILLFSWLCFSLVQAQNDQLMAKDVNRIMKQIFSQHLQKKNMTPEILKKSFRIYIDQFDPNRVYLLDDEVRPFLEMDDKQVNILIEQYRQHDLSAYSKLNTLIQKAVRRSQKSRQEIQEQLPQLLKQQEKLAAQYNNWMSSPKRDSFAITPEELKQRQKLNLWNFLNSETKRYGKVYVDLHRNKLVSHYEDGIRSFEKQYLAGDPSMATEEDQRFIIHVLKALAKSLDSHTTYMNAQEAYNMRVRLQKGYPGIGIHIRQSPKGVFVGGMTEGGPAERSGKIFINDQIIEVDGESVEGLELAQLREKIQGKSGSSLYLLLKRVVKGKTKLAKVQLKRETIVVDQNRVTVTRESFGNGVIGKIKLDSFYKGENGITSENDLRKAIEELDKEGNLRGLVLDLRENTGGFLSEAVRTAGLFITNGVVVVSKYSNGEERYYRDMDSSLTYDGPLIILTSKATASAAEIVAQALQDYGVAVVVGDEQTYGKGTIQSQTVTNNDGKGSYFKVTVGKYYTVSGKTPQLNGVKADIVVPGQFSQLQLGEEYLDYPMGKDVIESNYEDQLSDINPALKSWYLRYYMPTLQHKRADWGGMIPQLKKNSGYRMEKNKDYQMFLRSLRGEELTDAESEAIETVEFGIIKPKNYGVEDLQMFEAVNIIKDMIYIQQKDLQSQNPSSNSRMLIVDE